MSQSNFEEEGVNQEDEGERDYYDGDEDCR
jgi:hypothetical protein